MRAKSLGSLALRTADKRGHENNVVLGVLIAQLAQEIQARFVRHAEIGNYYAAIGIAAQRLASFDAIRNGFYGITVSLQNLAKQVPALLIVINN